MADDDKPGIKVTDRRMFTETGELREGFEEEAESSESSEPARPAESRRTPEAEQVANPSGSAPPSARAPEPPLVSDPADAGAKSEFRAAPEGYGEAAAQPQFLDLVAMLAEPAALFLGDATMPGQEPMEDLDRARMHIDLLGILQEKCQGNLDQQERAVLDDLVYRLRLRYVEKRG